MSEEEATELEELEAVEPGHVAKPEDLFHSLLGEPASEVWTAGYAASSLPLMLLDRSLSIIWANRSFQGLYGEIDEIRGLYLTQFFDKSFSESRVSDLFRAVKNSASSFSWRGQVERKDREGRNVICNLLVLPVFREPKTPESLIAFGIIIDDVTAEHHKLLRDNFTSLLEASRLKDNDTGNHIQRINEYCRVMTEHLLGDPEFPSIDREFLEDIRYLAAMHDVGKIGTSDNILNKAGPLEDWEWEIMKEHTINGAYILSTYPNIMAREIAVSHHEKWNGSGYPYAFSGPTIPLSARIVAIADVYDALRMRRVYKEPMSHEKAMVIIKSDRGSHFDPSLTDSFLAINEEFRQIYDNLSD
jgi:putative two-component system response regulator